MYFFHNPYNVTVFISVGEYLDFSIGLCFQTDQFNNLVILKGVRKTLPSLGRPFHIVTERELIPKLRMEQEEEEEEEIICKYSSLGLQFGSYNALIITL